jgi:hypothetical protein
LYEFTFFNEFEEQNLRSRPALQYFIWFYFGLWLKQSIYMFDTVVYCWYFFVKKWKLWKFLFFVIMFEIYCIVFKFSWISFLKFWIIFFEVWKQFLSNPIVILLKMIFSYENKKTQNFKILQNFILNFLNLYISTLTNTIFKQLSIYMKTSASVS